MNLLQQLGWVVAPQWTVNNPPPPPPAKKNRRDDDDYDEKVLRVVKWLDGWDDLVEAGQRKRGIIDIRKWLVRMDNDHDVQECHVFDLLNRLSQPTLRKWFGEKSLKEYGLWRNG